MAITERDPRVVEAEADITHPDTKRPRKKMGLFAKISIGAGILTTVLVVGSMLWLQSAVQSASDAGSNSPATVAPARPEPLTLPQDGAAYAVLSMQRESSSDSLATLSRTIKARLAGRGNVHCGGEFLFVVYNERSTTQDPAILLNLPVAVEIMSDTPVDTDGLSLSC